jgi:Protein of unknown function (DUF3592)
MLVGLILAGCGLVAVAIGLFIFFRTRAFLESAVSAEGTVKGHEERHSSDSGTTYVPVVEFTAADGRARRFTGSVASDPPAHEVGERVQVKYDPSNPEEARIGGGINLWLVPGVLIAAGIAVLVAGGIVLATS